MAFQEVSDLNADNTISLGGVNRKTNKKNPQQVEGYYLGSREVPDKKKKSGVSYIHIFQTPDGNLGVWGKTDLDRKISAVKPGTMVRASFASMRETPNGPMYVYKVEVDEDNTVDVSLVAGGTKSASNSTTDESGDDGEDTNNDDDNDETEVYDNAPPRKTGGFAAGSNTAASERVAALLGKNKNK